MQLTDNKCINKEAKSECLDSGGQCRVDIDGYYIEVALNVVYGIIWFQWGKRMLRYLQDLPIKDWHVLSNQNQAVKSLENELLMIENKQSIES